MREVQVVKDKGTTFFIKPKILLWNVQELNEANKHFCIINLLHEWKVDIVCLQEMKLKLISRRII